MKAHAPAADPTAAFGCTVCGARLDALHLEVGPAGTSCSFCGAAQARPPGPPGLRLVTPSATPRSSGLEVLRDARHDRGETLEQASRFTGIRLPYLRALEDGDIDSFDGYPGRVYLRFFLRQYAEHLGLEPGPLLRRFDDDGMPSLTPLRPERVARRPPRMRRWVVGAIVLLVALLTASALLQRARPERPVASFSVPSTVPVAAPPQRSVAPVPPARPDGVRVVVHLTAPSWIRIVVDGSVAVERTVPAGQTLTFHADDRIDLRLGNAGGVQLRVNGRPVVTGASGAVEDLSFAWRDGRLVRPVA